MDDSDWLAVAWDLIPDLAGPRAALFAILPHICNQEVEFAGVGVPVQFLIPTFLLQPAAIAAPVP
jgi:hypothetical protein